MSKLKIEDIEISLLLEAILNRYGYDFKNYSQISLRRRLRCFLEREKIKYLSELIPRILYNKNFFSEVLSEIFVSVTEMFRDPYFFLDIRNMIAPILKTYPFIKIWHAGCATGEEAYSMAILLHEVDLLDKTIIYCTDLNPKALEKAKSGIYNLHELARSEQNYKDSGGLYKLSDYYHSKYNFGKFADYLRRNMVFSMHNLVCDGVFNEMNIIFCRNVYIYFDRVLQDLVTNLFYDSLINKGFLCLGNVETIEYLPSYNKFSQFSHKNKIFQKQLAQGSWLDAQISHS